MNGNERRKDTTGERRGNKSVKVSTRPGSYCMDGMDGWWSLESEARSRGLMMAARYRKYGRKWKEPWPQLGKERHE